MRKAPAPLSTAPSATLTGIRLLATDIDGTVTHGGRIPADVLIEFRRLSRAGVEVLPVTGRPAGETLGLARYLPGIREAIAENGATLVTPDLPVEALTPPPDLGRLFEAAKELGHLGRPWTLSPDRFCRVGDVAWLREGRTDSELDGLRAVARELGVWLVWSSVHLHLSDHDPDKGLAVLELARRRGIAPHEIATIGDSANDVGLWHAGRFGLAVGTADVAPQLPVIGHPPAWITVESGASGWLELADRLMVART
ncbi:MAG: HAD family hydrolase [Myxococcota bacterium]